MANTKKKLPDSFWLLVDRLKEIANATRYKTEGTERMRLDKIDDEIMSIEQSGEQHEDYKGPTVVTPKFVETVLETQDKALDKDITVKPIEVITVSNQGGGNTLII